MKISSDMLQNLPYFKIFEDWLQLMSENETAFSFRNRLNYTQVHNSQEIYSQLKGHTLKNPYTYYCVDDVLCSKEMDSLTNVT